MTRTARSARTARTARSTALVTVLLAVVATVLLGALAGPSQAAPPGKAWVRIAHFVPGMGAANIQLTPLGGTHTVASMSVSGASYGQVTSYRKLTPGTYTATVRKTGATTGEPLLSRAVTLVGGDARTVAVLGTAAQPRLVLLQDDLALPKPGTARVRLLSASDAAQTVTVKAVSGPVLAQDAVLGQATGYTTVPDGTWDLRLSSSTSMSTDRSVRLRSGDVYTVVALNSGAGVQLKVITDAAGAMTAPKVGAADTGLGGMAVTRETPAPGQPVLAGLAGLAVLLLGARRLRSVLSR